MLLSLAKVKNPGPRLRDALKIPVTQHPGAQCMIQLLLLPELTNKPRSGSDEFQMSPCAHTRGGTGFPLPWRTNQGLQNMSNTHKSGYPATLNTAPRLGNYQSHKQGKLQAQCTFLEHWSWVSLPHHATSMSPRHRDENACKCLVSDAYWYYARTPAHSLHFQRISFFFKCPHLQPESSMMSIIHRMSDLALWKSTKRKLSKCFICLRYDRHGSRAHNGGCARCPDVRGMPSDSLNLLRLSSFTCGDPRVSRRVQFGQIASTHTKKRSRAIDVLDIPKSFKFHQSSNFGIKVGWILSSLWSSTWWQVLRDCRIQAFRLLSRSFSWALTCS